MKIKTITIIIKINMAARFYIARAAPCCAAALNTKYTMYPVVDAGPKIDLCLPPLASTHCALEAACVSSMRKKCERCTSEQQQHHHNGPLQIAAWSQQMSINFHDQPWSQNRQDRYMLFLDSLAAS